LWFGGSLPMPLITQRMGSGVDNFNYLAIPLFILAGSIMEHSGISQRLVALARALVGHITGGIGQVVIVSEVLVVDGFTALEHDLVGKPDPAMFWYAADLLDVAHERAIVVEDASSGVAAGAAGGFAFVLGVDRGGNRQALIDAGADLVVADLGDTLRTSLAPADEYDV
jgi:hypothetical protein